MVKKKIIGFALGCLGSAMVLSSGIAIAVYATKNAKETESVDYDVEADRQLIIGTYKSYQDKPITLVVDEVGYNRMDTGEEVILDSSKDMEAKPGQETGTVFKDCTDWAKSFLKEGETFTTFFSKGGLITVTLIACDGTLSSGSAQLRHSGVWFVGVPTKNGGAPVLKRSDVIYK